MQIFLPFAKYYSSLLTKEQILEELNTLKDEKKFGGLKINRFDTKFSDSTFSVTRYSNGLDGFTLEQFPVVKGEFISEKPTSLKIILKPNLLPIFFFALFVFTFIPVGIFIDEMTINGVKRIPTISERLMFAVVGGVIPGIWCYFGHIRPIKKTEEWIITRLNLTPIANDGS